MCQEIGINLEQCTFLAKAQLARSPECNQFLMSAENIGEDDARWRLGGALQ